MTSCTSGATVCRMQGARECVRRCETGSMTGRIAASRAADFQERRRTCPMAKTRRMLSWWSLRIAPVS
eukprot:6209225-Pleurochrysis_carterae.AAC.5